MNSIARNANLAFAWASFAAASSVSTIFGLTAPAQAFIPAYTTANSTGGSYTVANPSSFGFFFDTTSNVVIDALGFSYQVAWVPGSPSYTVKLWSFVNGGAVPGDYTEIASRTFISTTTYTLQDGYRWNGIAPINLPNTGAAVDPGNLKGYVIAAIGDFSGATGTVQFEGGTPIVDPKFDLGGNGFNKINDPNGFYPIPIVDGGIGINGYFNPNLSYVPGPLPTLGLASAFGMARLLRRRVKAAQSG